MGGWRSVYLTSAMLTFIMAALLFRTLPRGTQALKTSYLDLLRSLLALFRDLPILRIRAVLAP